MTVLNCYCFPRLQRSKLSTVESENNTGYGVYCNQISKEISDCKVVAGESVARLLRMVVCKMMML